MTSDNDKPYQEMLYGSAWQQPINRAIHEIYQEVFMNDTEQQVQEILDAKARLVKVLEEQIQDYTEKQKKNDIFGRKPVEKYVDPKKDYDIVVELGDSPEDTVIKTRKGEVLHTVGDLKINYNADVPYPTVTLTLAGVKIRAKETPRVEQTIKDSYLRSKLDPHISMESLHASLVNGEKPVIVPKEYSDTGRVISDERTDKPGRWQ